jgi:uncharacterized membrane protein
MSRSMNKGSLLLASAVAGIVAFAAAPSNVSASEAEKVSCYGVNKCKGTGACGGKGHSCAGENACGGKGYLEIEKETCLKIQGGRLTAEPEQK